MSRSEGVSCTCPPEHSVTKLGHCRTCEARPLIVEVPPGHLMSSTLSYWVCPPSHPGHVHDFNYATYADDLCTYGVCTCGYTDMMQAMWEGP